MGLVVELPDALAVKLAANGNADAFMALVRRYRAPLIGYIHGKTRVRDEAEDIAQEVFCRAWEHLPGLRDPAAFAGWLFRIAGNVVISGSRRPRLAPLGAEPVTAADHEPAMDSSAAVHAAVGDLPEHQRVVVSLRHFSGMPTDQIARVLGVPPGTVRSRLSRAYGQLRHQLSNRVEA